MCRLASRDGIRHIVVTPHSNPQFQFDRQRHLGVLRELELKVPELQFSLGCDFHLSSESFERLQDKPEDYVIGESSYLLVEFSDYQTPTQMLSLLSLLTGYGLRPIVTHPERNFVISQCPDLATQFVEMNALLQITANSLAGFWGREAKKLSEKLLRDGLISFIASDAHDTKRRMPILSEARRSAARILGDDAATRLVETNPQAVVERFHQASADQSNQG